ncbi:MAG: ATP-dependent zinc metalloprotease FtsH [Treponema sp.]|nr:ATP-dependent zinc metalloprotease FtsH [Candidatus Treponema equifaecale]
MADDNQNKDEKNKNEQDPYNFFKLSADDNDDKNDGNKNGKGPRFPFFGLMIAIVAVLAFVNIFLMKKPEDQLIDFSTFQQLIAQDKIERVEINLNTNLYIGYGKEVAPDFMASAVQEKTPSYPWLKTKTAGLPERPVYRTTGVLLDTFTDLLKTKNIQYKFIRESSSLLMQIFLNLLPVIVLVALWVFVFHKMGSGVGGGMGSIFGNGGNRSKAIDEGKVKTRFADVAGVDEAKEELVEVVDFLKEPKKYTDIGGKIPKGVLLVGPPGTGKTLLARAVAGEAGVPFFRISGSDFVEMFVGVGASRVRDLFRQAREKAPCIVFIDEIDALGKSRANSYSSNDEREQTLNQLLVEMDGFDNDKGLIVLAATNRADVLDAALLRPGRFDRQVPVEKPDVKGREEILRIHAKNVKLDEDVDFNSIAHGTIGFAGADLANVVNEAALLAVRNGHKKVSMSDFNDAIDKVSIGLKKKNKKENEKERNLVAYHETGHALIGAFTPDYPPVNKITVVPRSHGVGGFTQYREEEERHFKTKQDMINEVDSCLGGRAAEQIMLGEISTGASNDIQRATDIVRDMITVYGMSSKFRNMTLGKRGGGYSAEPSLIREFSEETQKYIDEEISKLIDERYEHVLQVLTEKKDLLEFIAKRLLEIETMEGKEFYQIVENANRCEQLTEDAKAVAENTESSEPVNPAAEPVEAPVAAEGEEK